MKRRARQSSGWRDDKVALAKFTTQLRALPTALRFKNGCAISCGPWQLNLGDTPTPGESDDRRGLRSDVFATLATYGRDPQLLAKSRLLVEQYMRDPHSVEAALAGNALSVSALDGNSSLYDRYLEHMKTAKTPEEYYNYYGALS